MALDKQEFFGHEIERSEWKSVSDTLFVDYFDFDKKIVECSDREIAECVNYIKACEGDALPTLFNLVTRRRTYEYSHHEEKEYSQVTFSNIKRFLEKIVSDSSNQYLLVLAGRMLLARADQGIQLWNNQTNLHNEYTPFKISSNQYAISVPYDGKQELVVSNPEDYQRIYQLLNEVQNLQPALKVEREARAEYLDQFSHIEVNDWPYDALDVLNEVTDLEQRENSLLLQIIRFFRLSDSTSDVVRGVIDVDEDKILSPKNVSNLPELDQVLGEKLANNLKFLYTSGLRDWIQADLGFDITTLTLAEQFNFLNFIQNKSVENISDIKNFVCRFKNPGVRTFLALEQGEVTGDEIIEFSERLDAEEIFQSYSALLDEANKIGPFVKENLDCEQQDCADITQAARARMLSETNQFLIAKIKQRDNVDIMTGLQEKSVQALGQKAVFGEALRIPGVTAESFVSIKPEKLSGAEAKARFAEQMTAINTGNHTHYEPAQMEALNQDLMAKLDKENTKVYTWHMHGHDLLSFAVVEEDPAKKEVFVSGLNIDPERSNSQTGGAIIPQIMSDYRDTGWTVKAKAHPGNARKYLAMGFVATGREEYPGEPYLLDLALHKDWQWRSKEEGEGQLLAHVGEQASWRSANGEIMVWKSEDPSITPPQLGDGYVISKMPKRGKTQYFILERADQTRIATGPQRQIAA